MSERNHRYRDGYFTVRDGLRLHYRDYPGGNDRPPLLCLPGLTRNARDFEHFGERLSPHFRVIALDFRGRAQSDYDPQPGRYNPLTYAGDALELLNQLMIARAIFVGTSLGGLVTMTVAGMAPQRIVASILNDIGPEPHVAGLDRIRSYVGKDVRFADWDEAARTIAANNSNIPDGRSHDDWVRMARRTCREDNGAVVFDYDFAIAHPFNTGNPAVKFDMWPLFYALAQHPLLMVRGEKSDLLTADDAERMQSAVPSIKLVTVPDVGHAPELDEPAAVAAIDEFLDTVA
jgi:pimeloyl-ACP methyl ester carboxylesterase